MNWNEISRQLRLMQAIVEEAESSGKMSDLERDLLLETLRKCYTEVRFAEEVEPVAAAAAVAAAVASESVVEEVAVEEVAEEQPAEIAAEEPAEVQEEIVEEEETIESEPEAEPAEESVEEPVEEPAEEPAEEEFFTSVRHKLDRKTIHSLYYDDAPAESAQEVNEDLYAAPVEETEKVVFEISDEEVAEDEIEEVAEESAEDEVVVYQDDEEEYEEEEPAASIFEITDTESDEEVDELPFAFREVDEEVAEEVAPTIGDAAPPVTVLGDVVGAERTTIADSIAPAEDVASVIGSRQLSSLRSAIGLNDKFLLIRDLFGGDNAAYEAAIDGLDGCQNLDDAMLYIFDNFEWNGESDGAQLLTELLSRRF